MGQYDHDCRKFRCRFANKEKKLLLVNAMSRKFTMKSYLNELKKNYDYIQIDCMPRLSMFIINVLAVADSVNVLV